MQLEDYTYAGPYISRCRQDFKRYQKLADNARKYHDMAHHITQTFHLDSGMSKGSPSKTADAIINLIDAKDLCNGFWERCMASCKELFRVEDADGVMVIFYYYLMGYSMTKVEKLMNTCKRTCWRHQKHALDELDYLLKTSGNTTAN